MAPKDEIELRNMLYTATFYKKGPIAIRYPRGNGLGLEIGPFEKMEIGKGEIVEEGNDVAILAIGNMVDMALKARKALAEENIDAEVVNMRFVKPLDRELLKDVFARHKKVLTIEDNVIIGGFGSAVLEFMNQNKINDVEVILHGLPDRFIDHGTPDELYEELKMDGNGIASIIKEFLLSKEKISCFYLWDSLCW
jgi:1-deoxy-D-xylulose-5-phosphate synthase